MKLVIALAVFIVSGCVTWHAIFAPAKLDQSFPARTSPESIEIFRSQTPSKEFAEIGTVSVCCKLGMEKSIELMRQEASNKGGDALIALDANANGLIMATVIRYH